MKKIPKFVWVLMALLVGAYAAWSIAYPSGTWRYKMTVTVETPEGIKTGSAVREVYVAAFPKLSPHMLPTVRLKGEAVVVDLEPRGVLFALLSGYKIGADYGSDLPGYVFYPKGWLSDKGIREMSTLKAGPTELDPTWYPKFVRFRDIADPKTVENLLELESDGKHPSSFTIKKDRFAEAFGAGVKLKSVTIEMTDEPVTWGVERWLPWLPEYYNKMFDGLRYNTIKSNNPFANSMSAGSFKAGDK